MYMEVVRTLRFLTRYIQSNADLCVVFGQVYQAGLAYTPTKGKRGPRIFCPSLKRFI